MGDTDTVVDTTEESVRLRPSPKLMPMPIVDTTDTAVDTAMEDTDTAVDTAMEDTDTTEASVRLRPSPNPGDTVGTDTADITDEDTADTTAVDTEMDTVMDITDESTKFCPISSCESFGLHTGSLCFSEI